MAPIMKLWVDQQVYYTWNIMQDILDMTTLGPSLRSNYRFQLYIGCMLPISVST